MLDESTRFSRARTLLPGATDCGSASTGTGEAVVFAEDPIARAIAEITSDDALESVARHDEPARAGAFADWPDRLHPAVIAALARRGEARAYEHQARAIDHLARGAHVVVATPTASGKSRVYQAPVLTAVLADPRARALWIFPTKALARDQVEAFRSLAGDVAPGACGAATYDGDTPPDERRAARRRAHVVATNPDMLHRAILPNHERWADFLAGLSHVVLDEAHVYRGIFGSHVAWVLRRLRRLCARYGSAPRLVACSATIANPVEHVARLWGAPVVGVEGDRVPAGPRTHLIVEARLLDAAAGIRRNHVEATRRVVGALRRAGVVTAVFCRTRRRVELLTRYLREDEARDRSRTRRPNPAAEADARRRIRGYRGGYLPDLRRQVERDLRAGEVAVVATTSALELGVDIGALDAVVLSGYPGSVAAARQRGGRAGRRGGRSLVVTVLGSDPRDRFVAASPEVLWSGRVEQARIDPANPRVVVPHLRCAAHEAPLDPAGDAAVLALAREDLAAAAEHLVRGGRLVRRATGGGDRFVHVGGGFPADAVDLRGPCEEDFVVLEQAAANARDGHVLARVDYEDAPLYLHEGAIYPIEGVTYEVLRLDWPARKAFVRRVEADYYTEAVTRLRVRLLGPRPPARIGRGGARVEGAFVEIVRVVPGFKKIRFRTHETIGDGPVRVPDLSFDTTAALAVPDAVALAAALPDPARRVAAVLGAAHALRYAAAFASMCDAGDLGVAVLDGAGAPAAGGCAAALDPACPPQVDACLAASARPGVLIYDRRPGGAGLADGVLARFDAVVAGARRLVARCGCEAGCPACVGAGPSHTGAEAGKRDAETVLRRLAEDLLPAGGTA